MKQVKVKILGVELEAPLMSPKVIKKFEDGKNELVKKANEAKNLSDGVASIEAQCDAVIEFIDDVFGAGSARKVLGEETDLLTCLDAFAELMQMYEKQVNPIVKKYTRDVMSKIEGR